MKMWEKNSSNKMYVLQVLMEINVKIFIFYIFYAL